MKWNETQSETQTGSLWRKVRPQVVCVSQHRVHGRRVVGKLAKEEEEEAEPAADQRRE